MTANEESEMHALVVQLETLTRGTGWEAMRYLAIGRVLERIVTYCAVCDCQTKKGSSMTIREALDSRIPRVRKAQWTNPKAYLRLPLFAGGTSGPWAELYDDDVQAHVLDVRPGSQRIPVFGAWLDDVPYEIYSGPISPFEHHAANFASGYSET